MLYFIYLKISFVSLKKHLPVSHQNILFQSCKKQRIQLISGIFIHIQDCHTSTLYISNRSGDLAYWGNKALFHTYFGKIYWVEMKKKLPYMFVNILNSFKNKNFIKMFGEKYKVLNIGNGAPFFAKN